jgi:glutathione S-transferase
VAPVFPWIDGCVRFPILYSFRRCPYAIRARMAIVAAGATCILREVSLADKPAEMLQVSPKATVPVMVLPNGGVEAALILEESLDIMAFVLGRNDPKGWLKGVDDANIAWVARNDSEFKYHLDRYKYPDRYACDSSGSRASGLAILLDLNDRLRETGFLVVNQCSLVDAAIFPFVRQFAAVDAAWFAAQEIPNVQAWLAGLCAGSIFNAAMVTFPKWRPNDQDILFP